MPGLMVINFLLLTFLLPKHEYHVSVMELAFNQENAAFEIALQIHTEDLARYFNMQTGKEAGIQDTLSREMEDWLSRYLLETISITTNQKEIALKYYGYEMEVFDTWCYFSTNSLENVDSIYINNYLFCPLLPDQVNIINYNSPGNDRSFRLTCEQPGALIVVKR